MPRTTKAETQGDVLHIAETLMAASLALEDDADHADLLGFEENELEFFEDDTAEILELTALNWMEIVQYRKTKKITTLCQVRVTYGSRAPRSIESPALYLFRTNKKAGIIQIVTAEFNSLPTLPRCMYMLASSVSTALFVGHLSGHENGDGDVTAASRGTRRPLMLPRNAWGQRLLAVPRLLLFSYGDPLYGRTPPPPLIFLAYRAITMSLQHDKMYLR
ncbi:hypothetical protein B0H16DRAFT_1458091 [Mycena metata]|uniref:Uncharacterized protein n=1 Tax=Mycena metata TaxID=1033252 RepID=A0AAD7J6E7_9AGAR|nr:hypothetical protein B0H16DRAFT_1458091 [Mycena metata]